MKKESPTQKVSVRLSKADQGEVKFIQERLSRPGFSLNMSVAIKSAIHAFANVLRSQKKDRRGGNE